LYLTLGKNQEALGAFQDYLRLLEEKTGINDQYQEESNDASEHIKEKERVILAIERLVQQQNNVSDSK